MHQYNISSKIFREFLIQGPPPGPIQESINRYLPGFDFRPVRTIDEFNVASQLIYQEFLSQQFILPHHNHRKILLHQILPSTVTFVAHHSQTNKIMATVTVIEDSPLGLPMDAKHYEQLISLRLGGRHLVEFNLLAMNHTVEADNVLYMTRQARLLVIYHLLRSVLDYLRMHTEVNTLVVSYKSKHDPIYKLLAMDKFEKAQMVFKLTDNWALIHAGRFEEWIGQKINHPAIRLFFGDLPIESPYHKRLFFSESEIKTLFVDHSNLLLSLTEQQMVAIQRYYPLYNLRDLAQSKDVLDHLTEAIDHHFRTKTKTT
ncbi:MAG: hypothetical protein KCHDKBKB_02335 [Elusimicrobia bacterium]|nr:hypothetical protein [Elusimicrobiota bacterium]